MRHAGSTGCSVRSDTPTGSAQRRNSNIWGVPPERFRPARVSSHRDEALSPRGRPRCPLGTCAGRRVHQGRCPLPVCAGRAAGGGLAAGPAHRRGAGGGRSRHRADHRAARRAGAGPAGLRAAGVSPHRKRDRRAPGGAAPHRGGGAAGQALLHLRASGAGEAGPGRAAGAHRTGGGLRGPADGGAHPADLPLRRAEGESRNPGQRAWPSSPTGCCGVPAAARHGGKRRWRR